MLKARNVSESWEVFKDAIRQALSKQYPKIDSEGIAYDWSYMDVQYTFDDAIIAYDYHTSKSYEIPYTVMTNGVTLGLSREVEQAYVEKRVGDVTKGTEASLTGPIVMKNSSKKIAYAAVLVPGEPDGDNEIVTAEKIEEVAHGWLEDYQNVDLMHTLNNTAVPVESYILPVAMEVTAYGKQLTLPKGTWVMASKVKGDGVWEKIESGELTGYSVMGIKRTALKWMLDGARKSQVEPMLSFKRTLLRDLGSDWIAATVSIVDEPCVPKAKFFALKRKKAEPTAWWNRLWDRMFSNEGNAGEPDLDASIKTLADTVMRVQAQKKGRKFSNTTFTKLKDAVTAISALLEEAEKERQKGDNSQKAKEGQEGMTDTERAALIESMKSMITEVVQPIITDVAALKAAQTTPPAGAAAGGTPPSGEMTEEEFGAAVEKSLGALGRSTVAGVGHAVSKKLAGQDGTGAGTQAAALKDRDIYGRKIKTAAK